MDPQLIQQIEGYVGRINRIPSRSHLHLWHSQATCWSPPKWVCNDLLDGLTRTICQCLLSDPYYGSPPYYRQGICYDFTRQKASPDWGSCCTYWTPIACAATTTHTWTAVSALIALTMESSYVSRRSVTSCPIIHPTTRIRSTTRVIPLWTMSLKMNPPLALHQSPINNTRWWWSSFKHKWLKPHHLKYVSNKIPINIPSSFTTSKCTICPLAKFNRFHFHSNNNVCTKPFELIHSDVWGPYGQPTYDNKTYFLTLVDDHSRFTWTYLKSKCKATDKIKHIFALVKTQFNKFIKCIRSNNAKEPPLVDFLQE